MVRLCFNKVSSLESPSLLKEDFFKGTLEGLIQLLATESPLKVMKNAFYFTLKALFVVKLFIFLS